MSEKQYVFKPSELSTASCQCERCGTIILLNTLTELGLPDECPSCNHDLKGFRQALIHYRQFQRAAANLNLKLRTEPKTTDEA